MHKTETIKASRKAIQGYVNLLKTLNEEEKTREVSLAITKFQEARMHLGKALGKLGEADPYPDSKNPENDKIAPTADMSEDVPEYDGNRIKTLKQIRRSGTDMIAHVGAALAGVTGSTPLAWNIRMEEGVMWLGMELGRIRDNAMTTPGTEGKENASGSDGANLASDPNKE